MPDTSNSNATRATQAQHEKGERSNTSATRVQHEGNTNDTSSTLVKNCDFDDDTSEKRIFAPLF